MRKSYALQFLLLFPIFTFAQGRLVLNNNAFVVIDNNAKVVVENPATNAVSTLGTGGNIVTESEFDQLIWYIGTSTGTYVMPFTSQTTFTKIPFTANISAAGTGAGVIRFSTYPGPVSDNNTYKPSDVTHMFDYNTNSINNSAHVIDRFWIIDALGYGTKPTAAFTFTYRDIEHTTPTNTIVESDLGAQRFNSATGHWGDYLPQGTTNTVTNQTSGVPVAPADFFRSWTLSEVTNPLSVEVLYFNAVCDAGDLSFVWQTQSENDVNHFEIERLNTSNLYEPIAFVTAVGGSSVTNYSWESDVYRTGVFRLVEVTIDGNRTVKANLFAECTGSDNALVYFNDETNDLNLQFMSTVPSTEPLNVYDAAGRLVYSSNIQVEKGINTIVIPGLYFSSGMYMVRFNNGKELINEKVMNAY